MHDAIVVGLGPAGATAARELSRAGLSVAAVDMARFPRYKSCGGCISTKIERALDFDISGVIEETVYGAVFTYKTGRRLDIMSDRPVGHNVMRDRFDNLLVVKAREAGAAIIEGERVARITDNGASVTAECSGGRVLEGRYLLGADGASGITGRDYFKLNPRESAVSITAEVPYDRPSFDLAGGRLYIDFGGVPYGYAWIFPKEKFLSVGLAGDAVKTGGRVKEHFVDFVSSHEALKGLNVSDRVGWTVPIFYSGASVPVKGRVILAGDTGHLVDPFLGEGIYYAIVTAKAASSAIIESVKGTGNGLAGYLAWLEREIYPEFKAAEKLSDLVYNHPRLWYSILEKDPDLMLRFYNVIRGEETVRSFHDWVYRRISSRPWKVLRRWLESRLLPA